MATYSADNANAALERWNVLSIFGSEKRKKVNWSGFQSCTFWSWKAKRGCCVESVFLFWRLKPRLKVLSRETNAANRNHKLLWTFQRGRSSKMSNARLGNMFFRHWLIDMQHGPRRWQCNLLEFITVNESEVYREPRCMPLLEIVAEVFLQDI